MLSTVFARLLWILFTGTSGASSSWAEQYPWKCDEACLKDLLQSIPDNDKCLLWKEWPSILKPQDFEPKENECYQFSSKSPLLTCPKIINGTRLLANCNKNLKDFRIACVPRNDTMTWYRGIQSATFNGTNCLRWDEVITANSTYSRFFEFNDPSMENVASLGLHAHENFCRNPDSWSLGPWCYVEGGRRPKRLPCFKPCKPIDSNSEVSNPCLSRAFLSSIPTLKSLSFLNFYLLSLPVKTPPKEVSQFLVPEQLSYSEHCFAHDERANLFGPWTFTEVLESPKISQNSLVNDELEDSWERCYFACEDYALTCSPNLDFAYFGPKQVTKSGVNCASPYLLTKLLKNISMEYETDERFKTKNRKLWELWQLVSQPLLDGIQNNFYKNGIHHLTNSQCFNYRPLFENIDFTTFPNLKPIYENGIGCFIIESDTKNSVSFQPCFESCLASSSAPSFNEEPIILFNETTLPDPNRNEDSDNSYYKPHKNRPPLKNFEDKLDTGNALPSILLLLFSVISVIAAIIVCILSALHKI